MAKTTNGAQNDATAQPLANLLAPLLEIADHTEAGPLDTPTWRVLATRAVRERLGALLHAALQQTSRTDVPGDVQAMLAHVHWRAAAAALYQQQELAAILRWCAAADIPCIVLKGSALAVTLYADPALRPCGDLDLLFAPGAIPQVGEMLGANGYVNRYGQRAGRLPRATSEFHFSRCGPRPVIVEPHWHITSNPYYVRRMPVAWFWQQTATATIGGAAAWVLAPPAQFLHLVTHYYLHAQGRHLLWSFDIALLLARCAATWDWDALAVQAERFGVAAHCLGCVEVFGQLDDVVDAVRLDHHIGHAYQFGNNDGQAADLLTSAWVGTRRRERDGDALGISAEDAGLAVAAADKAAGAVFLHPRREILVGGGEGQKDVDRLRLGAVVGVERGGGVSVVGREAEVIQVTPSYLFTLGVGLFLAALA